MLKAFRRFLYKIAYRLIRIYWFIFRPKTKSALCLIITGEKGAEEILLIRHTYDTKGWMLPGGSVKYHEQPSVAAVRETREELGITAPEPKLLTSTDQYDEYHYSHVDYYVVRVSSSYFQIDDVEIAEARWFPLRGLPERMEGKEIIALL